MIKAFPAALENKVSPDSVVFQALLEPRAAKVTLARRVRLELKAESVKKAGLAIKVPLVPSAKRVNKVCRELAALAEARETRVTWALLAVQVTLDHAVPLEEPALQASQASVVPREHQALRETKATKVSLASLDARVNWVRSDPWAPREIRVFQVGMEPPVLLAQKATKVMVDPKAPKDPLASQGALGRQVPSDALVLTAQRVIKVPKDSLAKRVIAAKLAFPESLALEEFQAGRAIEENQAATARKAPPVNQADQVLSVQRVLKVKPVFLEDPEPLVPRARKAMKALSVHVAPPDSQGLAVARAILVSEAHQV